MAILDPELDTAAAALVGADARFVVVGGVRLRDEAPLVRGGR